MTAYSKPPTRNSTPRPVSVIVPVLNEAELVVPALQRLQCLRKQGAEVILVDGGSSDDTAALAEPWVDKLICGNRGRALQMNLGARVATGQYLLFLHVDTVLPGDFPAIIGGWQRQLPVWGFFRVRLSGRHPLLRWVETLMSWRSRLSGIGTGDQALFVRRDCFARLGGFPEIPLMEDISLCRQLKKQSRPLWVNQPVVTSSRRWEQGGILCTIWLMWRLRLAYFCGVPPQQLARHYSL